MNKIVKTLFYILISAVTISVVSSCDDYKRVNVGKINVGKIENVKFSLSKVEANIALSIEFDNQSSSKYQLKSGEVQFFKGKDNLFAELKTGKSSVLPSHTKKKIDFDCSVICYKPTVFVLSGLGSLDNVLTDDMLVDAELVVSQGIFSKKIKIEDTPIAELVKLFNQTK